MKKFDGVLIACDLDGTLAIGKEIDKRNIDAIEYFKANGGKFTFCTGRVYNYLNDIITKCSPNTHIITLNGAVIVDPEKEEFIYRAYLPNNYVLMFNTIFKYNFDINDIYVYYKDSVQAIPYIPEDIKSKKAFIDTDCEIHKIVFCFKNEDIALKAEEEANSLGVKNLVCTRSWPTGVEMLNESATKGASALRLKELIGAKMLVTVGDFENDIPMLQLADIGYAVENAIDSVKKCADKITVSVSDAALAAVISDLDNLL